ncbi:flagellar biosynthesis protein FliQ [Candidatus Epulonipiscium viviparus]|uniref:flagellar biosynthesis protein FliQ n=1 Tax=Candidatus Epulonipiscium viviparus TaxID=420336 RepID=UPI00016C0EED|nr:flagellar biosynthesis protein FliQ [Candidatus Epulopiscium viviparus]
MEGQIIDVMRETIMLLIKVASPILLVALSVGLIVSIFQTVTSIQEQTLAFIPKILAVFAAIIFFGPWMLTMLSQFVTDIISKFSDFIV